MKRAIQIACVLAVVGFGFACAALGDPVTETMWSRLTWTPNGAQFTGGGSGYGDRWYVYHSDEPMDDYPPPHGSLDAGYHWHRQWFRSDSPGPSAWQWIEAGGTVSVLDPYVMGEPTSAGIQPLGWVRLAINYTTEDWPGGDAIPPMAGVMEEFIVREVIFEGQLTVFWEPEPTDDGPAQMAPLLTPQDIYLYTEIPDYQPKWMAIGIQGHNITFTGQVTHQAVPEPATLTLLALGGLTVLKRRRRGMCK